MLDLPDQQRLLTVARDSIKHGLEKGSPLPVDFEVLPTSLRAIRASFVTLHKRGQLRGCIGHLEATQPLVADVASNAYAAAFADPRFPALTLPEFADLTYHISILHPPESMQFTSETDLLVQLRPGVDGLILQDGPYRATFLPSVWSSLPAPPEFLRHLKHKAGLSPDHWSSTMQVSRYTTEDLSTSYG